MLLHFLERFYQWNLFEEAKQIKLSQRLFFPEGFSLSANPKHFSNKEESLKFLHAIIILYVNDERSKLKLPKEKKAFMVMDIFTRWMTDGIVKKYQYKKILIVNVLRNMTNYHQLLEVTVNGYCNRFLKQKFSEWYSPQVLGKVIGK